MNISDSEITLESLAARISQLEVEQNIRRKNIAWLKQYFDQLKQDFQERPEIHKLELLQKEFIVLNAQFAEFQQSLNDSQNLAEGADNCDASTAENNLDDTEVIKQFFERVEKQTSQQSLLVEITNPENPEIVVNEAESENDVAENEPENQADFTNLEFQLERIMWLVNRTYASDLESQDIPIDGTEFWRLYEAGERDFSNCNLARINLSGKTLQKINLTQANLKGANIRGVSIISGDFSAANLQDADMSKASLNNTKLSEANFDNANLHQIKFISTSLENVRLRKANLVGAYLNNTNLSGANLSGANLTGLNLRKLNLSGANLSDANLQSANLLETNLEGAKLAGATMPDGTTHD
ncbi:pentapeptide repeat-containing protein [Nodularia harveyana UHCC-0300]|uniref:Pentapeptide repeat-containing protein n=1 Tax=Nodularia harveyana UHCC-0300 TaxID=2974287 RepID=A0ABU5UEG4_9CYAN|nr:pentapeptide repeat-containing protein [Nodularia harveyana]MEA5581921.1 pentapeptide repeat-containing protein [Nodularia harveyana UHCC-0300]